MCVSYMSFIFLVAMHQYMFRSKLGPLFLVILGQREIKACLVPFAEERAFLL